MLIGDSELSLCFLYRRLYDLLNELIALVGDDGFSMSLSCRFPEPAFVFHDVAGRCAQRSLVPLTLLSFSSSLIAYQRFRSSAMDAGSCCFHSSIAFSMSVEKIFSSGAIPLFVSATVDGYLHQFVQAIALQRRCLDDRAASTIDSRSVSIGFHAFPADRPCSRQ